MQRAIEEIYENVWELLEDLPKSEEYERVKKEALKNYETLEITLSEVQKQLLEELCNSMGSLEAETNRTHFIRGFNYGIRIVSEAGR